MAKLAPFTDHTALAFDAPTYVVITAVDLGGSFASECLGQGSTLARARAASQARASECPGPVVGERVLRDTGRRVTRRKVRLAVFDVYSEVAL